MNAPTKAIFLSYASQDAEAARLETAYRLRDPGLASLKIDNLLDPLRNEPRFQEILRKLKFPS
jgi:hypothetical protein